MSHCTGAPADQWLEQYVAGTLPDPEAQQFEEHYFDCPACFARLRALQVVAEQMRRNPAKIPGRVLRWPAVIGAIGAVAALLLITVIGYPNLAHRTDVAVEPGGTSSPARAANPVSPASTAVMQLADLTLPTFEVSSLRGEGEDARYKAGMKAYASGDCSAAINDLGRVPARSADALAAQFYAGVCQMKLNQLDTASATLGRLAGKGDSPQQEAALYYLAQIALLRGDSVGARKTLQKVVSLHGDFEQRAKTELKKITETSPSH